MRTAFFLLMCLITGNAFSQSVNDLIGKGNNAYLSGDYHKAILAYRQALQQDPFNYTAAFNLGNALYKQNDYEEAARTYNRAANNTKDKILQSRLAYNEGVALTQLKAQEESIAAYKQALRFNPSDTLARENLQRTLNEKSKKDKEDEKTKANEKKDKDKPQPQKLNKKQVEQLLKALEEQERKLHDQMMKKAPVPNQPEKDW